MLSMNNFFHYVLTSAYASPNTLPIVAGLSALVLVQRTLWAPAGVVDCRRGRNLRVVITGAHFPSMG